MRAEQARALVALLKAMYPRAEVSRETWNGYAHYLADLEYAAAKAAIDAHIMTSTFFPAVAEIRERVAEDACRLPGAEEAWLEVERAVRRFDPGDSSTWTYPEDFSCLEIGQAAQALGGVSVLHERGDMLLAHREFVRAYGELRRAVVREAQIGGHVSQLHERPALKELTS